MRERRGTQRGERRAGSHVNGVKELGTSPPSPCPPSFFLVESNRPSPSLLPPDKAPSLWTTQADRERNSPYVVRRICALGNPISAYLHWDNWMA